MFCLQSVGTNSIKKWRRKRVSGHDLDQVLNCKAFNDRQILSTDHGKNVVSQSVAGALVEIKHTKSDQETFKRDIELTLNGTNGWASFNEIHEQDLSGVPTGYINFISLSGGESSLELDGEETEIEPRNNIATFGTLIAHYTPEANLRIQGIADLIWKDANRLNPTQWERMSWEYRSLFLGFITLFFSKIGRVVWRGMEKNEEVLFFKEANLTNDR